MFMCRVYAKAYMQNAVWKKRDSKISNNLTYYQRTKDNGKKCIADCTCCLSAKTS